MIIPRNISPIKQPITEILCDLERTHFYGSLEIKFEAGRVVMLRKSETIKLNCRSNRGKEYEQQ